MPTLVLDTGRAVTKTLATLRTLVRLLPGVRAPVFDQIRAPGELLPTEAAHMGLAESRGLGPASGPRAHGCWARGVMRPQESGWWWWPSLFTTVGAEVLDPG